MNKTNIDVNVVLFAEAAELAGESKIQLQVSRDSTVRDLIQSLVDLYPNLTEILPRCMIAVDHEYATEETDLSTDCEVGLIPPVSGG